MLESFLDVYSIINNKKNKNIIIIFGKDSCYYCENAVQTLQKYNIPYKYINIEKNYKNFFQFLKEISQKYNHINFNENHKTVPVIFFNSKFIGGYSDLVKFF